MHQQPVFKNLGLLANESCPVAERLAKRGFYLPSGLKLTAAQMDRAVAGLADILT
jgi:perosamine synthetase